MNLGDLTRLASAEAPELVSSCPGCASPGIEEIAEHEFAGSELVFQLNLLPRHSRIGYCLCARCGLLFWNPRYSDSVLARYYGEVCPANERLWQSEDDVAGTRLRDWTRARFARVVRRLARRLPQGAAVADVGGNDGGAASALSQAGLRAAVVDPRYPEIKESSTGLLFAPSLRALSQVRAPDALLSLQTLEHVPDVRGFLGELGAALDTGSWLYVEVPYEVHVLRAVSEGTGWRGECHAEHINFFGRESLANVLRCSGFKVVEQHLDIVPMPAGLSPSLVAIAQWTGQPVELEEATISKRRRSLLANARADRYRLALSRRLERARVQLYERHVL